MRIKRTFVKNRMMEKVEDVLANTTCNLNKYPPVNWWYY